MSLKDLDTRDTRERRNPGKELHRSRDHRHSKGRPRRRFSGFVIVACAIIAAVIAADHWANSGEIYRGVSVAGVDVGGKTPEEAQKMMERRAGGDLGEIRLTGPRDVTLTAKQIGFDLKASQTTEKAYSVGREGNVLERLSQRAQAAFGGIDVTPQVDYRPEVARSTVKNIALQLNKDPRQASVEVSGSRVGVTPAREGYKVDVEATTTNVRKAIENLSGEAKIVSKPLKPEVSTGEAKAAAQKARQALAQPLVLNAGDEKWTLSQAQVGQVISITRGGGNLQVGVNPDGLRQSLPDMYKELETKTKNADFKLNGGEVSVVPAQTGKKVDQQKLIGSLGAGLFSGTHSFKVPVSTAKPELTTAKAQELKPTKLIGKYRTTFRVGAPSNDSPARVENLRTASQAITGTTLAPGEVFSANQILAPLDYNKTSVFIDGRVEQADGGGLCQVNSTLYMATNYAGLDVVERHPHYAELSYIRPGFDATVWFGGPHSQALDYKFKNTTSGYVLVREYVRNGYIYAEIWGKPTDKKVKMNSKQVALGSNSSKWVTHKKVKKDGKVLFDGVLHTDTYKGIVDKHGYMVSPSQVSTAPIRP